MHGRIVGFCLAAVVLGFAACGKSSPAPTTAVTPPGVTTYTPPPLAKTATYSVALSGTVGVSGAVGAPVGSRAPAGAPNGSGLAVISVNAATSELCWKFSQLTNVTAPTVARVFRWAAPGSWRYGFALGHKYKSSGCIPENRIFLGLLTAKPQDFYVSIHTTRFPGGAVRGEL